MQGFLRHELPEEAFRQVAEHALGDQLALGDGVRRAAFSQPRKAHAGSAEQLHGRVSAKVSGFQHISPLDERRFGVLDSAGQIGQVGGV